MARREQGIALIGLLALLTLGASYWLVAALANPANRTASDREHNARVLNEAKQALIGRIALDILTAGENNPGRLVCPEAPGSANNFAAGTWTIADDGVAAGNCALPAVGRLPWRTLGIDRLVDASGEPLWYVVSQGWAFPGAGNTIINSNTPGQLTLDAMGDVVALIIAPGRPLNIQAGGGCVARNQARVRAQNVAWDARDFLDCTNSDGDALFATGGPDGSFNDQVLAVTAGDVLPVIESAVATRFVRDFGAQMRYCDGLWTPCTGAGAAVFYPFAATFGDPATASYQGQLNLRQGLPPLSFSAVGGCTPNTPMNPFCATPAACNPALDNRCAPNLVTYRNNPTITKTGGASNLTGFNCAVAGTPNTLTCDLSVSHSILTLPVTDRYLDFNMVITSDNVGMALRDLNTNLRITGMHTAAGPAVINNPYGYSFTSARMNADGSADVTLAGRVYSQSGGLLGDLLCGLLGILGILWDCTQHTITVPFMWVDEPMLYANNATMDWWYRNGWHQLTYYAVSPDNAPSGDGTCAGATCLTVTGGGAATSTDRAIVVMPGRALAGQNRTAPTALNTWLEAGNATVDDSFWGRGNAATTVNRSFNDHVVTIGRN